MAPPHKVIFDKAKPVEKDISSSAGCFSARKTVYYKLYKMIFLIELRLKLESQKTRKKKNAAAVYSYQAGNDGEWGEIRFDFERGTAEIIRLADWDTMRTNIYAKMVIRYVMKCKDENLPKEIMVGFER